MEKKKETLHIDDCMAVDYIAEWVKDDPEHNIKEGWDVVILRLYIYVECLDKEVEVSSFDEEKLKSIIEKQLK